MRIKMRVAAALATLLVTGVGATAVAPRASATATAPGCTDYIFVGARGSGEPGYDNGQWVANNGEQPGTNDGIGTPLFATFSDLEPQVEANGESIGDYAVDYPAVPVTPDGLLLIEGFGSAYQDSVNTGVFNFESELSQLHNSCPNSLFIVGGYSQGAQVVATGLADLSNSSSPLLGLISSVVLYGDPDFNGTDSSADESDFDPGYNGINGVMQQPWSEVLPGIPVHSVCHNYDPICNIQTEIGDTGQYVRNPARIIAANPGNWFAEHENYDTRDASNVASEIIGDGV
ncbi:cutinase family protein [Flexivirga caeni]|nr:cutinase family protein [Flexivirga caeni]